MKPLRQEIKDIWHAIHRLRCCVQEVINDGGGNNAHAVYVATITTDLSAGSNTIAHGIAGDIRSVFYLDNENRKLEFADERYDNINVYIKSNEDLTNVKIVLFYEV
jgi:hypothetical protein